MMKILHTSDWHLGQVFYKYDRSAEQHDFLAQLAAIVKREQPDAMVVSGDVYDTGAPSAATVKMFTDGMLAIHKACPAMTIVVTAGNHDSPSRIESEQSLWQAAAGIHMIGVPGRKDDGQAHYERNIIAVKRSDGTVAGYIAAVPYVNPANFPAIADGGEEATNRQSYYFQHLLGAVAAINRDDCPVVLMAHLAVTGADFTGHKQIEGLGRMGCIDTVAISALGTGYDYLALGHIHRPQNVSERARYCGTPLAVSFDEQCEHSVTIATLQRHEPPLVRTVPIKNLKPLHTLPPGKPADVEQALKCLEQYDDDKPGYICLNVEVESYLPGGATARAAAIAAGKKCCFCTFKTTKTAQQVLDKQAIAYVDFKKLTPLEIASQYYTLKIGREMNASEIAMFNQACQEAQNEKNT